MAQGRQQDTGGATTMGDLSALIERVEKATGPHFALDNAIAHFVWGEASPWHTPPEYRQSISPAYTASLDAALALVEEKLPGCDKSIEWISDLHGKEVQVYLHCPWGDEHGGHVAKGTSGWNTSALAVLSALLRALQSQQENSEVKDAG